MEGHNYNNLCKETPRQPRTYFIEEYFSSCQLRFPWTEERKEQCRFCLFHLHTPLVPSPLLRVTCLTFGKVSHCRHTSAKHQHSSRNSSGSSELCCLNKSHIRPPPPHHYHNNTLSSLGRFNAKLFSQHWTERRSGQS